MSITQAQLHRPLAPRRYDEPDIPSDGVARSYSQLVALLTEARKAANLSGSDVDDIVQWPERYTEKLEHPHLPRGRAASIFSLFLWLEGLGLGLRIVRVKAPRKGWKRERING